MTDKVDAGENGKVTHCFLTNIANVPGVRISWETDRGFWGGADIWMVDEKIFVDTECMGKDFVKELLCKMIDEAQLDD